MKINKLQTLFLFAIISLFLSCSGGGGNDGDNGGDLSQNACGTLGLNTRVAAKNLQLKIINGSACSENRSPVAKLLISGADGSQALCSGTMITNRDVLTAAHCFGGTITDISVSVNGTTVSGNGLAIHPGARGDEQALAIFNDVALVRLSAPVNVPTVPIVLSQGLSSGQIISIFGFGKDESDNLGTLESGQMLISDVSDNHITAVFNDSEGSNTCVGDSGGPAILSFVNSAGSSASGIVGVTSSGSVVGCGNGDRSLFANLQSNSIIDFITSIVPEASVI